MSRKETEPEAPFKILKEKLLRKTETEAKKGK